ncbi:MAG: Eco57I restriction-modification methylase domain-containing protein [Dolichospermum sp.]
MDKLRVEIENIESGKIYDHAFEWRFEFPEVLNNDGDFIGFDVVIGNPPYIRQEVIKNQKPYLQTNFITYSGTADLYVFFVEKGFNILKAKGHFCYIMPNKWMQAGYGKALRTYILENQLQAIIDFGDVQVFEEATTYPCILNASKQNKHNNFISAAVKTLNSSNKFAAYIKSISNQIKFETLNDETWVISSDSDQKLLLRINSNCVSLAEYIDNKSFRGIVTGLTEAFLIDKNKRIDLISQNSRNKEIIKSILQGRNIEKYLTPNIENYILFIPWHFPLHINSNIKGASIEAELVFKEDYPAIYNHLLKYKEKLERRNSTETGIRYEWYAMQRWASNYYQEFEKPKIMYQTFQVKPCFIYDEQGLYCNNSMWIISKADKVLLAILNSKMGWWLISKYCTAIQNGFQLIWKYFGQIPVPQANPKQREVITFLVDQILTAKKSDPNADTTALETEIDQMVYQLYNLTVEEIKIIESSQ